MFTRDVHLFCASLCFALLGCSEGGLVDYDQSDRSDSTVLAKSESIHYVPYWEQGSGHPAIVPENDLGVECGSGEIETRGMGESFVAHLGKAVSYSNGCFNPATATGWGKTVYVAANGDELFDEGTCDLNYGGGVAVCELTLVGGTGRFENAHTPPDEPIVKTGVGSPAGSVWTSVGRISSVGSSD